MMNAADKKFIKEMIPHHQMAIKMAKMVIMDGEDAEVKKMANTIIKAQEKEIEEMRKMLPEVKNLSILEMIKSINDFIETNKQN